MSSTRPSAPPSKDSGKISGRTLITIVLGAIVVVLGVVFWIGATATSQHVPGSKPGVGFGDPSATATAAPPGKPGEWDGGAIEKTLHDRRVRDELRKRILEGWAKGEGEVANAAREGKFLPAPVGANGGGMDKQYIRDVVRGDFFPMAQQCYQDFLSRKPDAGPAELEMSFSIVADEKLGGIVEDLDVNLDGGTLDSEMQRCMHESFMTVAFRPPAHGGSVTVKYPIAFSRDEPDQ